MRTPHSTMRPTGFDWAARSGLVNREAAPASNDRAKGEGQMSSFKQSRRNFMQNSALMAAAFATSGVAGLRSAFADRSKELNILCWEGYNSAEVLDPFRQSTGATVKAESLTNDPTMINRLRAGETNVWDLINVNNPWARKVMFPEKLIQPLDRAKMEPYFEKMGAAFKPPYQWAMDESGNELIGMAQRYGPYSFVVNTDKLSREAAEDQGWDLWNDAANAGKYGVLESDDWNVFNICCIAGFDPFKEHTPDEIAKFTEASKRVFKGAKVVGDIATMNQALVSGEIDFHMTGGTYSASPARADGATNIRAITPKKGPLAGGKGGISWIEITSVVNNPDISPLATQFLEYVQDPKVAHTVAFAEGTFNPVSQMGNPDCFSLFTKEELDAIQYDSLEEEMARSVEYDIVPDYDKLLDIMTAAKREASGG
jgi:spermidine/putrescine transport system substrate-binding protein